LRWARAGGDGGVLRMKLDIPAGDFAGYIFDLDGTLIDSNGKGKFAGSERRRACAGRGRAEMVASYV